MLTDNYVDDFFWVMPPIRSLAKYTTNNFSTCLEEAGIEKEHDKKDGLSTDLEIIGLEWDTQNMVVKPSKEKQNKILNTLYKMKIQKWCTLNEPESMIGKLSHCAVVIWPGKAFIRRLRARLYKTVPRN